MTEEVRITSSTGGQKGVKPARFDLIPADALTELAEHYGKGAEKYERVNGLDNWRNGYNWSLTLGAAYRHLTAILGGEDIDEETGSKHAVALMWHAATLTHFMNTPKFRAMFDDRQDVLDHKANRTEPEPGRKRATGGVVLSPAKAAITINQSASGCAYGCP